MTNQSSGGPPSGKPPVPSPQQLAQYAALMGAPNLQVVQTGRTSSAAPSLSAGSLTTAQCAPQYVNIALLLHEATPRELFKPVLVRLPGYAPGVVRRLPCGSGLVAVMRTAPYYEPDALQYSAEFMAERDAARRGTIPEEQRMRGFAVELAMQLYNALVRTDWKNRIKYFREESLDCLACPSAGIRAWRLAVMLMKHCVQVPWPKDQRVRGLLPQRLVERRVPFVETPSCILISRHWIDSWEVQAAQAEARGAQGFLVSTADRERRLAKVRRDRSRRRRRDG